MLLGRQIEFHAGFIRLLPWLFCVIDDQDNDPRPYRNRIVLTNCLGGAEQSKTSQLPNASNKLNDILN